MLALIKLWLMFNVYVGVIYCAIGVCTTDD